MFSVSRVRVYGQDLVGLELGLLIRVQSVLLDLPDTVFTRLFEL